MADNDDKRLSERAMEDSRKHEMTFDASDEDAALVIQIVKRAKELGLQKGRAGYLMQMDLRATHANGCPMDFARLLAADDFNLAHDVMGIYRHLNRTTGKLTGCFMPRFVKRDADAS